MMPKGKAEWIITYRCDLKCVHCNHLGQLPPRTPDMTPDDARLFVEQAAGLGWHPYIRILGGEPTLHPDFLEFLRIAQTLSPGRVDVMSNGASPAAQAVLAKVRGENLAGVNAATIKRGSVHHTITDWYISPADVDPDAVRTPCLSHHNCGISVDAGGYSMCSRGGVIDGFMRAGLRTRNLADLADPAYAARQLAALCRMCGHGHCRPGQASGTFAGMPVSPSWLAAMERAEE